MNKIKAKESVPLHGDGGVLIFVLIFFTSARQCIYAWWCKKNSNGPNGSMDGKSKLQAQPNYAKALTSHNSRKWAWTNS